MSNGLGLRTRAAEIQIWATRLNGTASLDQGWLSPDERDRASRFKFPAGASRYIHGRVFLRAVLGRLLDMDPSAIRFSYGPRGKPFLQFLDDFHFNLSHAADLCVVATCNTPIGVDVEKMGETRLDPIITRRVLTLNEQQKMHSLSGSQREEALLRAWTRKEAWAKARGLGLADGIESINVGLERGGSQFADLELDPGYVGSAAVLGDNWTLSYSDL